MDKNPKEQLLIVVKNEKGEVEKESKIILIRKKKNSKKEQCLDK